jgi:hypothetical protein
MAVRILVATLALALAGFLVVQERGARAADRITRAALADPSPERLAAAQADLATAQRWNPDTNPAQELAIAEARAGQQQQALERLVAVTEQEPEDAGAFQLLCSLAKRYDSDLAVTACARARVLAPPVGSLKRSSGRSTR